MYIYTVLLYYTLTVISRRADFRGVGGVRTSKDMHWRGAKSKGPPIIMNMFAKRRFCLDRFFLLKILKTAYHSAKPRFYNNNHNTSMFITHTIYCIIFICVHHKLIIVTVCLSVKSIKESPRCYSRTLRSEGRLRLAASEHIVSQYYNIAFPAGTKWTVLS